MNKKDLKFMYSVEVNKISYDFMLGNDGLISAWDGETLVLKGLTMSTLIRTLIFREPLPAGVNVLDI